MNTRFKDRTEAGRRLAEHLHDYAQTPNLQVLALPRGGVPVAAEVARALHAPLDIFVVRKLGLPEHPELAMGAVASGGGLVLNQDVITRFRLPRFVIESVAATERVNLQRQEHLLRNNRPPLSLENKTVILVDDGIATGASMSAAYKALELTDAREVVIAVPVLSAETFDELQLEHEKIVAVMAPEDFSSVGQWYENFGQVTDSEVREILADFDPNKFAQYA